MMNANKNNNSNVSRTKEFVVKELMQIPGVGKSIANDFWNIGIRSLSDLKNENPENLYRRICEFQQTEVDKCLLYVCRCAVYFTSNKKHDAELLKWWNWKTDDTTLK